MQNLKVGLVLAVGQKLQRGRSLVPDQGQNLDHGPEDVHTEDIPALGLAPVHTEDAQRADHTLRNIGDGGAAVTLPCLIGGGIMVVGQTQILTCVLESLA